MLYTTMPKRFLLLVLALLLLTFSVSAQESTTDPLSNPPPMDELIAIARFFPADTGAFFVSRIDIDFIRGIDSLVTRVANDVDLRLDESLMDSLDDIAREYPGGGGTFEETFDWLGDTVAFGVLDWTVLLDDKSDNDSTAPMLFALAVDDPEGVVTFNTVLAQTSTFTVEETDTYTLYIPPRDQSWNQSDPYLMTTDEAIFVASTRAALPIDLPAESLALGEHLQTLPNSGYNMLVYVDYAAVMSPLLQSPFFNSGDDGGAADLAALYQSLPPAVMGLTAQDGRALMLDFAQAADMMSGFEAFGYTFDYSAFTPIDDSFTRYIPRDTAFVIHATNLSATIQSMIANMEASFALQAEMFEAMGEGAMAGQFQNFGGLVEIINMGLRGATGRDLEALTGWMTGNYALTLDFSDSARSATTLQSIEESFPIELGYIIEVSEENTEIAAETVEALREGMEFLAEQSDGAVTVGSTTMGDSEVITVSIAIPDTADLHLVIGTGDGVFVIGTRDAAAFALDPQRGAGLSESAGYADLRAYVSPNAETAAYILAPHIVETLDIFYDEMRVNDIQSLNALLYFFGTSAVSVDYDGDGGAAVTRMVLVLPEE